MKRFLLFLVALVITSVCFAQDVIVKKDGSTIMAKVLKVTQSEVEYKKFDNQSGPTYTIATKDLQCINYENGSKDSFVSENYNPSIVTNETSTQYSDDQKLLSIYNSMKPTSNKKTRTLKLIGWIGAPIIAVSSFFILNEACVGYALGDQGSPAYTAPIGLALGTAWWAGFYFSAKHIEKKSQYSVQSMPLYQHEFQVGKNSNLTVGVDMLKDNTFKNQTIGLGLSYNF